ncbi:RagB/SusD family nutrient uptake outer membrane protein [Rufibacter latericius]|uniref:RagB/SusD family nutrient uptake outer membrane protein n=1 Tax=Rufibacter latericius TaxID=2487040 RepID=A0A3M9MUD1_9BACT|nr:RagB/SusD family nutrient uptake outer membrane protein [Rufibacter latericius]RNI28805.1 RagB/SusD family nutrient uptake outer membrane protein [Rufibacter latericius]
MRKILFCSLIAASLVASSCQDELEIENPNSATIEFFWKTSDDAQMGVNAIYSTLHRSGPSRWLPFLTIIRSDEGLSNSPAGNLNNATDKFIQPDYNLGEVREVWSDMYVGINRANQVLDNVPSITMDETLKQRLIGEAKFLRGFYYYHLASLWGNVPLMLTTPQLTDVPATAPQAEVWAQVVKDLTEAAAALPTTYPSADLGRATKGAAYALLAKALMQQGKYNEALPPLRWLVEEEGRNIYNLMPNYRDNFLITRENNQESVFEIQFAENPTENHDDDTDPRTDQLNYGTSIAQFFGPPGIGWTDGEAHRWVTREFLKETTTAGTRDPRLEASFLYDSTDVRGPAFSMIYGQTMADRYRNNPEHRNRVFFRKFQNDHWKNVEGYRSPNNWRFIRYADVLLMYAEAINATSGPANAYQYVDRVRQRAGLAPLSTAMPNLSQAQFLNQLKHERITELSGEGHRWNDLARWGDLGPQLAQRDPAFANFQVGKHEFLPIPQLDLDINPNLVQNPNW